MTHVFLGLKEGKVQLFPISPNQSSQENHRNRETMTHRINI